MATPNTADNVVDIRHQGSTHSIPSIHHPASPQVPPVQRHLKKKEKQKAPRPKTHCCSKCPSRFDRPCALKQHTRTHTGERPYRCKKCGRAFTTTSNLNRHDRICIPAAKRALIIKARRPQVSNHNMEHSEYYGVPSSIDVWIPSSQSIYESGYPPSEIRDQRNPLVFAQPPNINIVGSHRSPVRPHHHLASSFGAGPSGVKRPEMYPVAQNAKAPLAPMDGSDEHVVPEVFPLSPPLSSVSSGRTRFNSTSPMSTDVESLHSFPPSPSQSSTTPLFPPFHYYDNAQVMLPEVVANGGFLLLLQPKPVEAYSQTNYGSQWHGQAPEKWPDSSDLSSIGPHGGYPRSLNSEYHLGRLR